MIKIITDAVSLEFLAGKSAMRVISRSLERPLMSRIIKARVVKVIAVNGREADEGSFHINCFSVIRSACC